MSDFNFIYAEEHLSHREKAVYIYLRDRADASGVCWPGIKTIARELGLSPLFRHGQSSGLWQIWSAGSSLRSETVAAPTAVSRAIYTG